MDNNIADIMVISILILILILISDSDIIEWLYRKSMSDAGLLFPPINMFLLSSLWVLNVLWRNAVSHLARKTCNRALLFLACPFLQPLVP